MTALNAGKTLIVSNCAELGDRISLAPFAIQQTNSWMIPPFDEVTAADFVTPDTTGAGGMIVLITAWPTIEKLSFIFEKFDVNFNPA